MEARIISLYVMSHRVLYKRQRGLRYVEHVRESLDESWPANGQCHEIIAFGLRA